MKNNSPIWTPSSTYVSSSRMLSFQDFVSNKTGRIFKNYKALHDWSVTELSEFWQCISLFFNIKFVRPYTYVVKNKNPFFKTKWFGDSCLSYVEHIERNFQTKKNAILYRNEKQEDTCITWNSLFVKACEIKKELLDKGVKKGDCVVGYLPNHPVAIAAFLATNSIGAVWSCCSPDFGVESVISRLGQLNPVIFIGMREYSYNGKKYNLSDRIKLIQKEIPTIEFVLYFETGFESWNLETNDITSLESVAVEYDHPIWVLYSSGTTGKPKAITHRTGGILMEQYKAIALHQNLKTEDRFFWHTSTGWMMWNYALGALLCGGVLCIYDGSPNYPDLGVQWRFASEKSIDHFGHGASFFIECMKNNLKDIDNNKLTKLKSVGSTGSPLSKEAFYWLQKKLPKVQLISLSGGTDVCSAFLGGNPFLPVYAGHLQCEMLGASVECWNEKGEKVNNETGELVITNPMPCMPIYFWGDNQNKLYTDSYFHKFKGVWTHGDWIQKNETKGIKILGRSDSTLNRKGIRIGTSEIYSALDKLDEIVDSIILDLPNQKDHSQLFLFVVTNKKLDFKLINKIKNELKFKCSPQYIPDKIISIKEVPYTLSGKKLEIPIKKILLGGDPSEVINYGSLKNPTSLDFFIKRQDNW
tara:strand:+ start:332 stop:2254 length:1923 start_codon:yes stop_codon:yes gene_type:complete